jgi:DNA repair ATPase RecN
LTLFLQVCAGLGGLTFLGTIIGALAVWRKSKAEAGKTGADAIQVLTDNALKAATTAIENVEKQAEKLGRQLEQTQDELAKTREELVAVRQHMGVLDELLRQHQIPAPKLVWPPHRNGVA